MFLILLFSKNKLLKNTWLRKIKVEMSTFSEKHKLYKMDISKFFENNQIKSYFFKRFLPRNLIKLKYV